ncbi:MAG: 5-carboxymethyl-2-hydroxymuconate Delta-isomerase [Gammaproteobacteria bacterium]|nr:5-carboxymethyl-2-hydroxymuconate Delta-isomerase [Gammaproteobacteria bacterium]
MPHVIVEYSANLETQLNLHKLLDALHESTVRTGVFPIGGLRTRAARRDHYRIADGHVDNAFVHVVLRIGHGRDLDTRKRAAEMVFATLCGHLENVLEQRPIGVSLEVQEIDSQLSYKKNNMHDYVAQRQASVEGVQ